MEYQRGTRSPRRRRNKLVVVGVCSVMLLIIVAVCLGITVSRKGENLGSTLETTIIGKCKTFLETKDQVTGGNDCERVWSVFAAAFVGRDPCLVPPEAYDPLVHVVNQTANCNRMLFWSRTKELVHAFTREKKCLVTLEDTLLGFVMDGLTWCGRKDSQEVFTTGCPGWSECEKNPVRSFWNQASASFAESACGHVTVMLNGSISTPFNPSSIFANVEVKKFNSSKMSDLTVVLVTREKDTTSCDDGSLQILQKALDPNLKYSCKEVQQAKIFDCISDTNKTCGNCW